LMVKSGAKVDHYATSFGGRLISVAANNYKIVSEDDDEQTSCNLTQTPNLIWSCYFAKDNIVWHFGEADKGTFKVNERIYRWYITGIEGPFGQSISFNYGNSGSSFPELQNIEYAHRDIH